MLTNALMKITHVSNAEDVQVLTFYIKLTERSYQRERQMLLKWS